MKAPDKIFAYLGALIFSEKRDSDLQEEFTRTSLLSDPAYLASVGLMKSEDLAGHETLIAMLEKMVSNLKDKHDDSYSPEKFLYANQGIGIMDAINEFRKLFEPSPPKEEG